MAHQVQRNQSASTSSPMKEDFAGQKALNIESSAFVDSECQPQLSKSIAPVKSSLSLLMIIVIIFSAITGLLMGYDLCMIAVILQPIVDEFGVCPPGNAPITPTFLSSDQQQNAIYQVQRKSAPFQAPDLRFLATSSQSNEAEYVLQDKSYSSWNSPDVKRAWESESIESVFSRARANAKIPCSLGTLCLMHNWDSRVRHLKSKDFPDHSSLSSMPSSYESFGAWSKNKDAETRRLQGDDVLLETPRESEAFQSCGAKQLFVSIVSPGGAVGSLSAGFFADAFGRKFTLALSDALIMLGCLLMSLSYVFSLVVTGRFILGLGVGAGFVIFSTYVSEISPDDRRGQLVSCQEVAQCIGCLTAYCVAAIAQGANIWRAMLLAAGVVAAIQTCGILLLPESPRWLIRRNKLEKAQQSLRKLAGLSTYSMNTEVPNDYLDQGDSIEATKRRSRHLELEIREGNIAQTLKNMIEERHSEDIRIQARTPSKQVQKKKEDAEKQQQSLSTEIDAARLEWTSPNDKNSNIAPMHLASSNVVASQLISNTPPTVDYYTGEESKQAKAYSSTKLHLAEGGKANCLYDRKVDAAIDLPLQKLTFAESLQKKKESSYAVYISCLMYWRPLMIAVGCAVCQNLTGSTAILYYSAEIFSLAGVADPLVAGTGIGIAKVIGITIVIFTVDRVGRKRFLLIGSLGTFLCHLLFAVSFALKASNANDIIRLKFAPTLAIVTMITYMFFINISWAGLMFVVASEVLPSCVRGIGMGFTITAFWVFGFFSQSTLETLMQYLSITGFFLLYAAMNILALLFTWFYIPELTGKSLEEITEGFG